MDTKFAEHNPSEFTRSCGLTRRALQQALGFMESSLSQRVRLQDVADAACVSRYHFARQFRLSTGTSPMKYLTKIRIERAKQLLKEGNILVGLVAADLGFADQSHFIRHFRRLVGQTPKSYADLANRIVDRHMKSSGYTTNSTSAHSAATDLSE